MLFRSGFGFEAVSGEDTRIKVMKNAIGYLDGSIILGVEDRHAGTTYPDDMRLDQNFPNPFNPSTEIRYLVGTASEVDLSVFDVVGRPVGTLAHGQRQAGFYAATWNGSGYPSGVYFYRIITSPIGGQSVPRIETRMMILVK